MFALPWFRRPTSPRLPGGLQLDASKEASTRQPVSALPLPTELVLPLSQHSGAPAKPLVTVGESVAKGQLVARGDAALSAPIHAPSSGTVVALEDRPIAHPSGLSAPCLVIACDGQERWAELPEPWTDFRHHEAAALRQRIRESGIVGLGGATFPTHVKLSPGLNRPINLLILNGAECEPYISCDDMLMRERPGDILDGLAIMAHALGVRRALIAVEEDKPEAIAALRGALYADPPQGVQIELRELPRRYPTGGERQLIQLLTGQEVPSKGLPADLGVVCHNVGTARAVADAVLRGKPLISRYVTVTGDGVAQAQVREVLFGTPVAWLIEQCGGYRPNARQLLMGGPMMGFALPHDRLPVSKASNCFLLLASEPAATPAHACIRCGDCHQVCPVGLLPQQLYGFIHGADLQRADDHRLFDCIECGCCAAVCPSQIPLVDYYRFAKTELRHQARQRQQADVARERHEARQARLSQEQAERAARQQRKRESLDSTDNDAQHGEQRQAAIQAARERARKRRATRSE